MTYMHRILPRSTASIISAWFSPTFSGNGASQTSSKSSWASGSFQSQPPTILSGRAPMSPPPCTLFCPRKGLRPEPYLPTWPVNNPRSMSANTPSAPLWCSVMPSVQFSVALSAVAYMRATSRISSAETPVICSAYSDVEAQPLVRLLDLVNLPRVDHDHLGAVLDAAAHVVVDDGVALHGVGTPAYYYVGVLELLVRGGRPARSKRCHQTGDAGGVSSTVTRVYVAVPEHLPDEPPGQVVQL